MKKQKQTYSLTEQQIKKLRIAAAERVVKTGEEFSASQMLGELIDQMEIASAEPKEKSSRWATAAPKEGRAIVKPVDSALFDNSSLDDVVASVKRDEEQLDMYSKK